MNDLTNIITNKLTSSVKDLKIGNQHLRQFDTESNSETDDELDEQTLEVQEIAENLERLIGKKDVSDRENIDECITVLQIVFKRDTNKVESLIVCIAGAVAGVNNCSKQIENTTVNITTLWIYNKEFRQSLEAGWDSDSLIKNGSLPHKAYASPLLEHEVPMKRGEGFLSFILNNIQVKHFSPELDKSKATEWKWIVELMADNASGNNPHVLTDGSTRSRELSPDDTKFKEEARKNIEKYKKASFYPRIMTTGHLSAQQESSKLIATMSFTWDNKHENKFKSLVILSIGEQSKFVDPPEELVEAKTVSHNIRRNLGPSRNWGIYTCAVQGDEADVWSLKEEINQHWGKMENGPLTEIACHAVYVDREDEFEKQKSMNGEKIKLTDLKSKRKNKKCDLDVHSHIPQDQALHRELKDNNDQYAEDWRRKNSVHTFIKKHCDLLKVQSETVASFQYPTIQLGFAICEERGARNHMIYFTNPTKSEISIEPTQQKAPKATSESTKATVASEPTKPAARRKSAKSEEHHIFPSQSFRGPRRFDLEKFSKFLENLKQ